MEVENPDNPVVTDDPANTLTTGDTNPDLTATNTNTESPDTSKTETEQVEWDRTVEIDGVKAEIEIPDSVASMISEKGLDAVALAKEYYTGGFSEETRGKLDAAFGKPVVDIYLASLATQSAQYTSGIKAEAEKLIAAEKEHQSWGESLVVGETFKDWDSFSASATEKMSDEQVEQFNAAMSSGNKFVQEYAIKAAMALTASGQVTHVQQPAVPDLETSSHRQEDGYALSAKAYRDAIANTPKDIRHNRVEYAKYQADLDARRRAGIKAGL